MDSEKQDKILEMVRRQLDRTEPPSTEALYGRAVRIDASIRGLTLRQFHARYPLRVHRERARAEAETTEVKDEGAAAALEGSESGRPSSDPAARAALRELFLDVAKDVARRSSDPALIEWVADHLEDYVERAARVLVPDGTGGSDLRDGAAERRQHPRT